MIGIGGGWITMRRAWLGVLLALLVGASVRCSPDPGECEAQCRGSRWYDGLGKEQSGSCYEACVHACTCGFIPSPLGSTGEHFMEVCAQSDEDVRAQVLECFHLAEVPDGEERWCGEADPACPAIETCLLEELDASVVGKVRIDVEFYDGELALERCQGGLPCEASAAGEDDEAPGLASSSGADGCDTTSGGTEGETGTTGAAEKTKATELVHPCAKEGIQLVQVMAVRDEMVISLFELECGVEQEASPPRLAADVPAGDFQYVARIRGLGASGKPLCLTSRADCVGLAGEPMTVRFGVDFGGTTWQCEDDIASCTDALDNDGDGVENCNDADCAPFCKELGEAACGNGIDDDGDGTVDCDDYECRDVDVCELSKAACEDGIDNDGDGKVDAEDDGCTAYHENGAEECSNGRDDDHDCTVDCDDDDCEEFCPSGTSGTDSTGA